MNGIFTSGLASAVLVGALIASAQGAQPIADAARTASAAPTHQEVTLLTGDEVAVSTYPDGRQSATVIPADRRGVAGQFQMYNLGRDLYVVPQSAVPYLGSTLSLGLFDVSQLARNAADRLRARVTFRAAYADGDLPGTTLRRTGRKTAIAEFTLASARRFGAALGRQWASDHASPVHDTGLFRSIADLAPNASAPRSVNQRSDDDVTLTIDATDATGNPDNGDGANIYNTDDMNEFNTSVTFTDGTAQVSVPPGHYAITATFADASGDVYGMAIPQFSVKHDVTEHLDARLATQQVSISTPKPATVAAATLGFSVTDALGNAWTYASLGLGDNAYFAEPTKRAPRVGQFHYYVTERAYSPTTAKKPYTYDLDFPTDGRIPKDQTYTATPGSLAAVTSVYGASHRDQSALDSHVAVQPGQLLALGAAVPLTTPMTRTEYYTARPDVSWVASYFQDYDSESGALVGEIDRFYTTFQPGSRSTDRWGVGPAHPRLLQTPFYPLDETLCPVCKTPNALEALAFPFGDNSNSHDSWPDDDTPGLTESTDWSVSADQQQIASGTGLLEADAPLQAGASTYSLTYDTTRSSADFLLSTATSTTWTFQAHAPLEPLPQGWVCSPAGDTDCGVVPVMTTDYALPVDRLGQLSSGTTSGEVTIGHLAGGSALNVKSFSATVSFDGGQTWKHVTVTNDGAGHYQVAFRVPSVGQTDGYGALQIQAKDAYGSTIAETIVNAFAVRG